MNKKKVIAIIPARMGALRFPGKPLVKILDLPMVEHVRRRVLLCEVIDEVYVATCDDEIKTAVERYGGKTIMTAKTHERCTDRVEEAVKNLDADIVAIFQGDEPLFVPPAANQLISPMLQDSSILCANLLSFIKDEADLHDQDIVKVVLDQKNYIKYFSRAPIPFLRVRKKYPWYRQTGISAFKKDFLNKFSRLSPTPLEITESIDFLRIIEHGYSIYGVVFEQKMYGVDQPEHVRQIEHILQQNQEQKDIYERIIHV